jgi:hypothetical protein
MCRGWAKAPASTDFASGAGANERLRSPAHLVLAFLRRVGVFAAIEARDRNRSRPGPADGSR